MAAMNPIHRWRSLSLLARFTLTGLSLTIAIALILGWALGRQLEQFALQHEADSAAATVALVLDPFFRPEDFAGLSTERYAEVDQFVRERAAHEHMVRIKIWDRDGRVIYADDPLVVGQRFEVEHELAEALEGEVATEISDLSKQENRAERGHFSRLMEIYVPIRLHGDAVVGAYELYRDLSAVEPRIADMQRSLWSSLALAFGALYLALFNLVRRASRELRRQNEELGRLEARREMDRLKSEFVSIVSHELRTPLASLVGFSELLLSREVGEAERRDWTETMHSEAERLSHLVEELLDVSRIEQGRIDLKRQPLDLKQAIERALAAFQGQSSGHRLEQRLQQPLPRVLADPDKLAQVLTNLVSNAIKYSPDGGPVTIAAEAVNGSVHLSVADRGLGLPPDELPRLFGRFHRVQDEAWQQIKGTGLGLYITRQLVELHGGRIWAESLGPNLGSTFHVELPAMSSGNGHA